MAAHTELLPEPLPQDPLSVLAGWLEEAWRAKAQPNPNAMVLATADEDRPSARVVLCKGVTPQPGYVVFYTNYLSRKGRELARNPRAAAVLHWDYLRRQVRLEGTVVKAPATDSDVYFASRPWQSRLGAWASAQSEPIQSRAELIAAVRAAARHFSVPDPSLDADSDAPVVVPRPPHWGGYRLWIDTVELWVEGEARIHDRARWSRSLVARGPEEFAAGAWTATRLQP
jgi:pyridoxamine 5'-phosphate oxidase